MGCAAETFLFLQKKHLLFCRGATPGFGEIYSSIRVHYNYQIGPVYNVGVVACDHTKKKKENASTCMYRICLTNTTC